MPTPGKRPSMRQIAVAAGVSVATVSHVINGNGRFSEDTRKRVEAALKEYGYVTNMAAKSLRMAQSRTIGMIVPDISNDFFSKIALHVERELATEDYSVFVCNSANDPARERDYFRTLASKQADGIICISGLRRLDGEFVPHGIPVVCIDRAPENDLGFPHVGSDNIGGGYMATEHLIERGCKDILSISSFTANYPGNERQMGYERALAAHGMPLRRDYQLFVSGKQPSIIESEELVTASSPIATTQPWARCVRSLPPASAYPRTSVSSASTIPSMRSFRRRKSALSAASPSASRTRDVRPCSPCCAAKSPRWRRSSPLSSCNARAARQRAAKGQSRQIYTRARARRALWPPSWPRHHASPSNQRA